MKNKINNVIKMLEPAEAILHFNDNKTDRLKLKNVNYKITKIGYCINLLIKVMFSHESHKYT